jgi:hypothetical protein
MNIYIDMDEVVANRSTAPKDFTNQPRVYRDLPVRAGGRELVNWVLEYQKKHDNVFVAFLTAVPTGSYVPWAFQDKVHWANFYFTGIPVFFGPYGRDKGRHCTPGDILIDDRLDYYEHWVAMGGVCHLYKEWPECKIWLEKTLGEL